MSTSAAVADRSVTWIATLFLIGSALFALPSIPAVASIAGAALCGATYFAGSLFFTSAATLVVVTTARGGGLMSMDGWAGLIQWVGTLWFNLNTFHALNLGMTAHEANLRVWTPDFLGSICFLVSSQLSLMSVCHRRVWCWCREDRDWTVAFLNLAGSVFFMLSALAAFTRPATDDLLDASLANTGTLLGALCFFWASKLMLGPPRPA
jgi:hypothetical protein